MRRFLLPIALVALAAATFFPFRSRPTDPPRSDPSSRGKRSNARIAGQPDHPKPQTPPGKSDADIRVAAKKLRAQARKDPSAFQRLLRTIIDPGQSQSDRDLAACVLGSLPYSEALLALSQALAQSTDPIWTRMLLLCIGSAKDWGEDDDAFDLEGQPHAVVVPNGLALTVRYTLDDEIVRRQVEGFLAEPLPPAVREAATFALRHSLGHVDVRSAFLTAAQAGSDLELQGTLAGPLAEWASHRPTEDVERSDILNSLLRLGSQTDADPLRFNAEPGFKQARLSATEVVGLLTLTQGTEFDARRWALSILGDQAGRRELPERTAVRDRVSDLLAKDPDAKIREFAAAGLAAFAGEDGVRNSLEVALRDVAWHVRARAAESLGRWPTRDERVREALQRATQDENPSVKAAGENGLRVLQSR